MASESDYLQFWQTLGIASGVVIAIATAIYGIVRKIYCKGKDDRAVQDKINYLEKRLEDQASELSELKEDIVVYRQEQKKINETILENQSEIKSDLSYIKGKIEEHFNH